MYLPYVKRVEVGADSESCDRCGRECQHQVLLEYLVRGPLGVFNSSSDLHYLLRCTGCGHESAGDSAAIESQFEKVEIPFMDRKGGVVFVVGIVLLLLLMTCFGAATGFRR